jgi:hypothetical protein
LLVKEASIVGAKKGDL